MVRLAGLMCTLALVPAWIASADDAPVQARSPEKIRVLITVGGHGFAEKPFFAMFDALPGIEYQKAKLPDETGRLKPGLEKEFDALVFYDMAKGLSAEQRKAFVELLNRGIGVVALHHNIAAHEGWPEYRKIIGAAYVHKATEIDGKIYGPSTATHGQDIRVHVADRGHPITAGIEDFQIHDETYGKFYLAPGVKVLLTTDHPLNEPAVAWTNRYGRSRVFYLMFGHDAKAWQNPNYPKLLSNGIRWAAGK